MMMVSQKDIKEVYIWAYSPYVPLSKRCNVRKAITGGWYLIVQYLFVGGFTRHRIRKRRRWTKNRRSAFCCLIFVEFEQKMWLGNFQTWRLVKRIGKWQNNRIEKLSLSTELHRSSHHQSDWWIFVRVVVQSPVVDRRITEPLKWIFSSFPDIRNHHRMEITDTLE